jgi:hypothetical protein
MFIPTLNAETRTVPVRVELANPGQLLKPAMFAQVEVPVGGKGQVVTVPNSAVIDSGTRQIVLIAHGEGRFEPRDVKLGGRSDTHLEVLEWREGWRRGRRRGQLPDRCGKQPESSGRRLWALRPWRLHRSPKRTATRLRTAPQTAGHRAEGIGR